MSRSLGVLISYLDRRGIWRLVGGKRREREGEGAASLGGVRVQYDIRSITRDYNIQCSMVRKEMEEK